MAVSLSATDFDSGLYTHIDLLSEFLAGAGCKGYMLPTVAETSVAPAASPYSLCEDTSRSPRDRLALHAVRYGVQTPRPLHGWAQIRSPDQTTKHCIDSSDAQILPLNQHKQPFMKWPRASQRHARRWPGPCRARALAFPLKRMHAGNRGVSMLQVHLQLLQLRAARTAAAVAAACRCGAAAPRGARRRRGHAAAALAQRHLQRPPPDAAAADRPAPPRDACLWHALPRLRVACGPRLPRSASGPAAGALHPRATSPHSAGGRTPGPAMNSGCCMLHR